MTHEQKMRESIRRDNLRTIAANAAWRHPAGATQHELNLMRQHRIR